MTSVRDGILCLFFLSLVNAQLELQVEREHPCSGTDLTFTCIERQNAQSVSFYKDNDTTTARCIVDLTEECSPTLPAEFPCGCVKSEGNVKTILYIPKVSPDLAGPWLCVIPVLRAPNIQSNTVAVSPQDPYIGRNATGLTATLAVVCVLVVIGVALILKFVENTTTRIVFVAVALVLLLAFLLAVGIYNINQHSDCVRVVSGLYEASLAFIIIGAIVGVGCMIAVIVVVKQSD